MNASIPICFIWHMHQPNYIDPTTNIAILPWVRLHAIKDYFDMVQLIMPYKNIHLTINIVPSLFMQLEKYSSGELTDNYLKLTKTPADKLTSDQKIFLLQNFFQCHWNKVIKPYPRYWELLQKRGHSRNAAIMIKNWDTQDFLDLQIWFNLSWFGNYSKQTNSYIISLIKKGTHFSEDDKDGLIHHQFNIINKIIPLYKQMAKDGRIELSISPVNHPIMPLLCNSDIAKEADSELTDIPNIRMPNDCQAQLTQAIDYCKTTFGIQPVGVWPPELAISNDVLDLVSSSEINWIITDERLNTKNKGSILQYRNSNLKVIFRNNEISNRIGFKYKQFSVKRAVSDFVTYVLDHSKSTKDNSLLTIALDGENAWEHYYHNGWTFLNNLYSEINNHPHLCAQTISETLNHKTRFDTLDSITPGSWINQNFNIWIGHKEDHRAWEMILAAKKAIDHSRNNQKNQALQSLHVAEGSDWTWWFGPEHHADCRAQFDHLFRSYIREVYHHLNLFPPKLTNTPIIRQ
jgi:alpha-amylase/alpha-mannosidase (GH57 family)